MAIRVEYRRLPRCVTTGLASNNHTIPFKTEISSWLYHSCINEQNVVSIQLYRQSLDMTVYTGANEVHVKSRVIL